MSDHIVIGTVFVLYVAFVLFIRRLSFRYVRLLPAYLPGGPRIGAFVAVCMVVLTHSVSARVIEVSKGSPEYDTIQKAVDAAAPGDVIKVRGGVYHETVTITGKTNLTIEGYDIRNEPAVIDGADQPSAASKHKWIHAQGRIYRTNYRWPHKQVTDEQFTASRDAGENETFYPMQVYEDDTLLRGYRNKSDKRFLPQGKDAVGGPYSTLSQLDPTNSWKGGAPASFKPDTCIPGRFLYKEQEGELYVWSADENNPSNHIYHIPTIFYLARVESSSVRFKDLIFKHAAVFALTLVDSDHSAVEDCYFVNNRHAIFLRDSSNVAIRRNLIAEKGFWERYWYGDSKHTLLHGAKVRIMGGRKSSHCEFSENICYGAHYMLAPACGYGLRVHGNLFSRVFSSHISLTNREGEYDARFYNNIFHHTDAQVFGLISLRRGKAYVYRNIMYRSGSISKNRGSPERGPDTRACFYHNTLVFMKRIIGHWYTRPVRKEHVYLNNIFHLKGRKIDGKWHVCYWKTLRHEDWQYFPFEEGPVFDCNLYWSPVPDDRILARILTDKVTREYRKRDFEKMTEEMGLEPHGLQADPRFVHGNEFLEIDLWSRRENKYDWLSQMDYRDIIEQGYRKLLRRQFDEIRDRFALSEDSPAIDRGVKIPEDWPDLAVVKDGKPDIGAVEHCNRQAGDRSASPRGRLHFGCRRSGAAYPRDVAR